MALTSGNVVIESDSVVREPLVEGEREGKKVKPKIRGLVVAVACFLAQLVIEGFILDAAVMYPGLKRKFDLSSFRVSLLGSVLSGLWFVMSPFGIVLCRKFGQRRTLAIPGGIAAVAMMASIYMPHYSLVLLLTGLVGGCCLGIAYLPSVTSASYHFTGAAQHAVIASGSVGGSLGFFVFSMAAKYIFERNPVEVYLSISACAAAQLVICGMLAFSPEPSAAKECSSPTQAAVHVVAMVGEQEGVIDPKNPCTESQERPDRKVSLAAPRPEWHKRISFFKRFKDTYPGKLKLNLASAVSCTVLWNIGSFGFLSALALSMEHDKASDADIAYVYVLQSILNVVGRVCACILAIFRIRTWLYFLSTVLSGVAVLVLAIQRTYTLYCISSAAYGLFLGYQCALLPSVALHLFGIDRMEHALSCMLVSCGLGGVMGPLLSGILLDAGAGYAVTMAVLGAIIVLGGMMFMPALGH